MKNVAIATICFIALLGQGSSAHLSFSEGRTSPVARTLKEATAQLPVTTQVPVRFPSVLPGLTAENVYTIIRSAEQNTYEVLIAATPDCDGQHACAYGTVIGTIDPSWTSGTYGRRETKPVSVVLHRNLQALFYKSTCRAYCDDALITWNEGNARYIIGLKAGRKRDLVKAANSAIDSDRASSRQVRCE